MRRRKLAPLLTLTLALVAERPANAQAVSTLDLTPLSLRMAVGERREVLASAYNARGDIVLASFRWRSSDPHVVRVDPDPGVPGVAYVVALAPGAAMVEVQAGGQSRTLTVTVGGGPAGPRSGFGTPTVLQIDPTAVYLLPSETIQLRPIFRRDDGSPAAPVPLVWRSFREDVARLATGGRVIGIAPGQGMIEARTTDGRLSQRVPVHVAITEWAFEASRLPISPGASDTVRVIVPAQERRRLDARTLAWGTANPGIVSVTVDGVVTGVASGRTEVVANGFGQELRLPVSVHRRVESLTLAPSGDSIVLALGGAATFRAVARGADDVPVPEAELSWEVADTAVVGFDAVSGTATGRAVGATTITVRGPGPGLEKRWWVRVAAAGLVVSAERLALRRGERRSLSAFYTDAAGRRMGPATAVRWTSSDPAIVRVGNDGTVEAIDMGSAVVVATTPAGPADSARVFVTGELLVSSNRSGSFDVYAVDRSHPARLRRIVATPGQDLGAVYAPDGLSIAYVSDVEGNNELYVADADGSNPRRLTTTSGAEGAPAWTPDGRRLVYQLTDGRPQIWIINADGTAARQLTQDGANHEPAVSADGRTIAYTRRDRDAKLYLMDLDGTNQRAVGGITGEATAPAWLGDSTLAFLREVRVRRGPTRSVTTMTLAGQVATLTPAELFVSGYAVAPGRDLVAATVPEQGRNASGVRMVLVPVGGGAAVEVPRQSPAEQFAAPSFRP